MDAGLVPPLKSLTGLENDSKSSLSNDLPSCFDIIRRNLALAF